MSEGTGGLETAHFGLSGESGTMPAETERETFTQTGREGENLTEVDDDR